VLVRTGIVLKTAVELRAGSAAFLCDAKETDELACTQIAGTDKGVQRTMAGDGCATEPVGAPVLHAESSPKPESRIAGASQFRFIIFVLVLALFGQMAA
jgi:hypothetical protein